MNVTFVTCHLVVVLIETDLPEGCVTREEGSIAAGINIVFYRVAHARGPVFIMPHRDIGGVTVKQIGMLIKVITYGVA